MGRLGWLTTAAACVILLGLGLGGGIPTLLAAITGSLAVAITRIRLGPLSAFTIGQVTLVAILGSRPAIIPVVLGEGALFALLLEASGRTADRRRDVVAPVVFAGVLWAFGWSALRVWGRLWAASGVLLGIGGLIAYVLHRYEQVQLGVVSGE